MPESRDNTGSIDIAIRKPSCFNVDMLFHRPAIHAIYVLCYLSKQDKSVVIPAAKVADAMEVPPEQAAKVLQVLQNVGLVNAIRGRSGGYKLARPLDEISVLEVVDALASGDEQDRLQPRECPVANDHHACTAHGGMVSLNQRVREMLSKESLAKMFANPCEKARADVEPRIAKLSGS
jgi:Rrf2 family protein